MYEVAERTQIMELIQTLPDEQIHYVLNIIQALPKTEVEKPRCTLRGRFSKYANPALREKENEAWGLAVEEKYGLR